MRHLLAALLLFASCAQTHATIRISDEQVDKLRLGMSVEEVRAVTGRPVRVVVIPFPKQEIHKYVMERGTYEIEMKAVSSKSSDYTYAARNSRKTRKLGRVQNRELWLTFVDGKLENSR